MKKLLALLLFAVTFGAFAGPNELILLQRNSTDTGNVNRMPAFPASNGLVYLDTTSLLPAYATIGSGLSLSSGVLSSSVAAQVNADWSAVSGVAQILNKPTLATVATTGAYSDLTGLPIIQAIQRTRAQTNTSGVLTWTFPNAYAGGVTPVISASIEDTSGGGASWGHVITAISNTAVTVTLTKTTAVTLLGVSVLGIAATPQAFVHLTAVAP